jgi:hypothetical protein
LGDGLWKTASGLGTFRQDIIDVRQGVAGTHIVMLENGAPGLFQARLKLASSAAQARFRKNLRDRHDRRAKSSRRNDLSPRSVEDCKPGHEPNPERSQLNTREEMTRLARLYPAGFRVGSFVKVDAQFAPMPIAWKRPDDGWTYVDVHARLHE